MRKSHKIGQRAFTTFKRREEGMIKAIDSTRKDGRINLDGRYSNSGFDKVTVQVGRDGGFCYSFGTERR